MKFNQYQLIATFILFLASPHFSIGQDSFRTDLTYEVLRIHPPVYLTTDQLPEASVLTDLNANFPSSWVKEYISLEIETLHNGKKRLATSNSDILSQEQKVNLNHADLGKEITVTVHYMPDNTLKHNTPKELSFDLVVDPQQEAVYPTGEDQLYQYLRETAVDHIPDGLLTGYALAAVTFTVDTEGKITEVKVAETSKDDSIDELFVESLSNMPCWKPAQYTDGTKVAQQFVLLIGNMESCTINQFRLPEDEE